MKLSIDCKVLLSERPPVCLAARVAAALRVPRLGSIAELSTQQPTRSSPRPKTTAVTLLDVEDTNVLLHRGWQVRGREGGRTWV